MCLSFFLLDLWNALSERTTCVSFRSWQRNDGWNVTCRIWVNSSTICSVSGVPTVKCVWTIWRNSIGIWMNISPITSISTNKHRVGTSVINLREGCETVLEPRLDLSMAKLWSCGRVRYFLVYSPRAISRISYKTEVSGHENMRTQSSQHSTLPEIQRKPKHYSWPSGRISLRVGRLSSRAIFSIVSSSCSRYFSLVHE